MNTYRIYEDLRSSLGEQAAKSLAHTLGPMFEELGETVTKTEFRELNATVGRLANAQEQTEAQMASLAAAQERTEAKVASLAAAQERTEAKMASLAAAQERTEAKVASLAAAQERTEVKVASLAAAQERTEATVAELVDGQARLVAAQQRTEERMAELAAAQSRTEAQLGALTVVVQTLVVQAERTNARLDATLGWTFELRFRDRLTSFLGRMMRRGRLLRNDEVLDAIESAIDAGEADEVLRADAIAKGIIDGAASHVVVEVSATCAADDVDRAERRAGILRKAGLVAVPLVACEAISREMVAYARSRQVRVWCNGTMLDEAA